jgi:hypothetical protein
MPQGRRRSPFTEWSLRCSSTKRRRVQADAKVSRSATDKDFVFL